MVIVWLGTGFNLQGLEWVLIRMQLPFTSQCTVMQFDKKMYSHVNCSSLHVMLNTQQVSNSTAFHHSNSCIAVNSHHFHIFVKFNNPTSLNFSNNNFGMFDSIPPPILQVTMATSLMTMFLPPPPRLRPLTQCTMVRATTTSPGPTRSRVWWWRASGRTAATVSALSTFSSSLPTSW